MAEIDGAGFDPVAGCCAVRAAARTNVAAKIEDIRRAPSAQWSGSFSQETRNAGFDNRPFRSRHPSVTSDVPSISRDTPVANGPVAESWGTVRDKRGLTVKIYTKTGDEGTTGLLGSRRLPKDDVRIEAYGTIDELNAVLGLARAQGLDSAADRSGRPAPG